VILVDTGPLVALSDTRDSNYDLALAHLRRLGLTGLVVCEAVLVEATFHLTGRRQRQRLREVLRDLRIDVVPTSNADFHADVFDRLLKYGEHEPEWADGCLAVLSGRSPRARVWTYDREFSTTWRRPDGSAIPLAIKE
jgi:predicted nucleic acid-binding protein